MTCALVPIGGPKTATTSWLIYTKNQHFTTIIVKIGWSKNHQLMIHWWRIFDEEQDNCMALNFLPTYWVGRKVHSGFSINIFQENLNEPLANPIFPISCKGRRGWWGGSNCSMEKFNSTLTGWPKPSKGHITYAVFLLVIYRLIQSWDNVRHTQNGEHFILKMTVFFQNVSVIKDKERLQKH